jgi:predicted dehydrogenase
MNYLLRSTPSAVRAWGSANVTRGVHDLAYFQLEYADRNVAGYGHVSWLDPRKVRQVTVVGSRKMAVYDDLADERLRIFDRGVEHGTGHGPDTVAPHAAPMSYRYGDIVSPHINFQEPLMLEDRAFIDCVVAGGRPAVDGVSGLAVMATLDAIDRALATGQPVDVDQPSPGVPELPAAILA